jgi:hypothetical protein
MRARDRRLGKLQAAIEVQPVRPELMDEWYPWFKDFGELPEDDELEARAVVRRAMHGGDENEESGPLEFEACNVRAALFHEALFDHVLHRPVARAVIATEVAYGGNIESPGFAAHHGLPVYGKVALHVMGYPRNLVLPPYESQAKQLLARHDELRARIDQQDAARFDAHVEAEMQFIHTGELPREELHRECVLSSMELGLLWKHKRGRDVTEAMALFAKVALKKGEERKHVLQELCEFAKAGKMRESLRPLDEHERRQLREAAKAGRLP